VAAEQQLSAAEARIAELQDRLRAVEASAPDTQPRPPAMAGPGDSPRPPCPAKHCLLNSQGICTLQWRVFVTSVSVGSVPT